MPGSFSSCSCTLDPDFLAPALVMVLAFSGLDTHLESPILLLFPVLGSCASDQKPPRNFSSENTSSTPTPVIQNPNCRVDYLPGVTSYLQHSLSFTFSFINTKRNVFSSWHIQGFNSPLAVLLQKLFFVWEVGIVNQWQFCLRANSRKGPQCLQICLDLQRRPTPPGKLATVASGKRSPAASSKGRRQTVMLDHLQVNGGHVWDKTLQFTPL